MGVRFLIAGLLSAFAACGTATAQSPNVARLSGQVLYLPVYSHIWHGDLDPRGQPVKALLSVLVSIRNTDPANTIRLVSARYFDTAGKQIKEYVPAAVSIPPMGTHELFIPRDNDTGGSGANFVISWSATTPSSAPIVEAVHANLPVGRSVIFITSAREIPR